MHGPASHVPVSGPARRALLATAAALALVVGPGCSRKFFRERADNDVAGVLTQKNIFPQWGIKNWHVYPDPRARFADPTNPDRPPYPPDDYAAKILSPNPQRPDKHSGAGRFEGSEYLTVLAQWDAENRAVAAAEEAAEKKKDAQPDQKDAPAGKKDGQPERVPPPKPVPPADGPGMMKLVPDVGPAGAADPAILPASEWVAARNPNGPPQPGRVGPTVSELREPMVVVAAGETRDGDKTIPAVAIVPAEQPPAQPEKKDPVRNPPDRLPDPGPTPKGGDLMPKAPGGELGPGGAGDPDPDYLRALATNEAGFRIKLEQAVELGLFNSREFQDRREDLYLAALPVTLQRFSFAAQAFFTETVVRQSLGREAPGGPRELWRIDTNTGFSRLFPTGATLLFRLANQFVIDVTGDRPYTSVSNLSLTLAQPFLRGGGFAVTLEPLTVAERTLLYAIRSFARFRKLYYVAIAAGGDYTNNPYGLQGLSPNLGRGIGANLTAPTVGYLELLRQSAIIANQRRNIEALEQLLRLYEAFREGGQQSDLQVGQVEIQLLNSRNNLLGTSGVGAAGGGGGGGAGSIRSYLDNLDNFKLQLGLPLTVGLDPDDGPLKPIRQQLARFDAVYAQIREVEQEARRLDPAEPVNRFRPRWRQLLTESPLVRGTAFAKDIAARWAEWQSLTDDQVNERLRALAEERRKLLDARADRQAKGLPEPEAETRRLARVESEIDLGAFELAVRRYEAQPWAKETGPLRGTVQAAAFRDVFNAFYQLILEGRNERLTEIRGQWPKLPPPVVNGVDVLEQPLDDAYTTGVQAALVNRLDLMNARGQMVDVWRQIRVQANSLQGVFDVRYNLNSSTPPTNADLFNFSASRTTNQVTFDAELPLVRRAERNNYRAALISYQRQRRLLQAFEDNIANDIRGDIRELRVIAELYRTQQRLIELGYSQVDNAQAILLAPPAPGAQTDAGSAAALTNQVLQAQQSLLQAQNTLYTIWVNYLTSRMTFYLDLELLQLDERGLWCDESVPGNEGPDRPGPEPARQPGERLPAPRPAPGPDDDR
jgi:hypothetical protein